MYTKQVLYYSKIDWWKSKSKEQHHVKPGSKSKKKSEEGCFNLEQAMVSLNKTIKLSKNNTNN